MEPFYTHAEQIENLILKGILVGERRDMRRSLGILVFGNYALRESREIKCGDVTKGRITPDIEKAAVARKHCTLYLLFHIKRSLVELEWRATATCYAADADGLWPIRRCVSRRCIARRLAFRTNAHFLATEADPRLLTQNCTHGPKYPPSEITIDHNHLRSRVYR
jgi:hypothetical protein